MTAWLPDDYKDYRVVSRHSRFGRSSLVIKCGWCGYEVEAYLWSLAGSGKRCPECKAIHNSLGSSRRPVKRMIAHG